MCTQFILKLHAFMAGVVYIAMAHGSRGMLVGTTLEQLLFFEYSTTNPPQQEYEDLPKPKKRSEWIAFLTKALENGDHHTFSGHLYMIRCPHVSNRTIREIHHNPKNHVLIPFLDKV